MKPSKEVLMARKLVAAINENMVKLGQFLANQHANKAFQKQGYGSFQDFLDAIPIHYRKAMHLIDVADAVAAGTITESEVLDIGWTKAMLIAMLPNRKKAVAVLKIAKQNTVATLRAYINGGSKSEKLVTKVFHLRKDECAELESILLCFGATLQSGRMSHREVALMKLVRAAAS